MRPAQGPEPNLKIPLAPSVMSRLLVRNQCSAGSGRQTLWSSSGWVVAAALGIFAGNRPLLFRNGNQRMDGVRTRSRSLATGVVVTQPAGRSEHRVFRDLSTDRSETKAIYFVGISSVSTCPYGFYEGEVSSTSGCYIADIPL